MVIYRKLVASVVGAVSLIAVNAGATDNRYLMPGTQCRHDIALYYDSQFVATGLGGALKNTDTGSQTVFCPVPKVDINGSGTAMDTKEAGITINSQSATCYERLRHWGNVWTFNVSTIVTRSGGYYEYQFPSNQNTHTDTVSMECTVPASAIVESYYHTAY